MWNPTWCFQTRRAVFIQNRFHFSFKERATKTYTSWFMKLGGMTFLAVSETQLEILNAMQRLCKPSPAATTPRNPSTRTTTANAESSRHKPFPGSEWILTLIFHSFDIYGRQYGWTLAKKLWAQRNMKIDFYYTYTHKFFTVHLQHEKKKTLREKMMKEK